MEFRQSGAGMSELVVADEQVRASHEWVDVVEKSRLAVRKREKLDSMLTTKNATRPNWSGYSHMALSFMRWILAAS